MSVTIKNLSKSFEGKKIIDDLNINFADSKISVIISPSGSGKTTLLNIIAGINSEDSGEVISSGNEISYVFQESRLFPFMNVFENIFIVNNDKEADKEKEKENIRKLLKVVGLEEVDELMPRELSGGMAMRVSIARALYNKPDTLLLDEAFAGLDISLIEKISGVIEKTKNETVIMATHDIDLAVNIADDIYLFRGRPLHNYERFNVSEWNKEKLKTKIKSLIR